LQEKNNFSILPLPPALWFQKNILICLFIYLNFLNALGQTNFQVAGVAEVFFLENR